VSLLFFLSGRTAVNNPSGNSTVQIITRGDAKALLSNILLSTAAVSGSIFAVVFGFSQFVVSNIADKYSPKMVTFFRRNLKYKTAYLLLFFSTIGSVSLLLLLDIANEIYLNLIAGSMAVVFTVSLLAFLYYYDYIYQVVNPPSFSRIVEDQIQSSDNLEFAQTGSAALADMAIKATNRRGEDENVFAFVDSLANVALHSIKGKSREEPRNPLFNQVMESLQKVHEAALAKGDANVTFHISLKVRKIKVALDASP
jgi:hypothetical protein